AGNSFRFLLFLTERIATAVTEYQLCVGIVPGERHECLQEFRRLTGFCLVPGVTEIGVECASQYQDSIHVRRQGRVGLKTALQGLEQPLSHRQESNSQRQQAGETEYCTGTASHADP